MARKFPGPPSHLSQRVGNDAAAAAMASREPAADRARKLLAIPARHEQIRRVPFYGGEVGIRVMDDLSTVEAHQEARESLRGHGFPASPHNESPEMVEYSVALSASLLRRCVVDPNTGFPLWDRVEDLRGDITREDIAYLDQHRLDHQRSVAPQADQVSQEEINAILARIAEEAPSEKKGLLSDPPWRLWPRPMLLGLLHSMASRLRGYTGSTCSGSTDS